VDEPRHSAYLLADLGRDFLDWTVLAVLNRCWLRHNFWWAYANELGLHRGR
jgi:hypothetical protein